MKLDIGGYAKTVRESAGTIGAAEAAGYDGASVAETQIDALTALAVAAGETSRIELGTGIVVAFARNPMTVALTANDVHLAAGGPSAVKDSFLSLNDSKESFMAFARRPGAPLAQARIRGRRGWRR